MHMSFPQQLLTKEGASNLLDMTIRAYGKDTPLLSFAVTEKDKDDLIGISGFNPMEKGEVEVSYALLPRYWGQGLATEILASLTEYVLTKTGFHTIIAPITKSNKASIRVAEKNGYMNHGLRRDENFPELICEFKKTRAK